MNGSLDTFLNVGELIGNSEVEVAQSTLKGLQNGTTITSINITSAAPSAPEDVAPRLPPTLDVDESRDDRAPRLPRTLPEESRDDRVEREPYHDEASYSSVDDTRMTEETDGMISRFNNAFMNTLDMNDRSRTESTAMLSVMDETAVLSAADETAGVTREDDTAATFTSAESSDYSRSFFSRLIFGANARTRSLAHEDYQAPSVSHSASLNDDGNLRDDEGNVIERCDVDGEEDEDLGDRHNIQDDQEEIVELDYAGRVIEQDIVGEAEMGGAAAAILKSNSTMISQYGQEVELASTCGDCEKPKKVSEEPDTANEEPKTASVEALDLAPKSKKAHEKMKVEISGRRKKLGRRKKAPSKAGKPSIPTIREDSTSTVSGDTSESGTRASSKSDSTDLVINSRKVSSIMSTSDSTTVMVRNSKRVSPMSMKPLSAMAEKTANANDEKHSGLPPPTPKVGKAVDANEAKPVELPLAPPKVRSPRAVSFFKKKQKPPQIKTEGLQTHPAAHGKRARTFSPRARLADSSPSGYISSRRMRSYQASTTALSAKSPVSGDAQLVKVPPIPKNVQRPQRSSSPVSAITTRSPVPGAAQLVNAPHVMKNVHPLGLQRASSPVSALTTRSPVPGAAQLVKAPPVVKNVQPLQQASAPALALSTKLPVPGATEHVQPSGLQRASSPVSALTTKPPVPGATEHVEVPPVLSKVNVTAQTSGLQRDLTPPTELKSASQQPDNAAHDTNSAVEAASVESLAAESVESGSVAAESAVAESVMTESVVESIAATDVSNDEMRLLGSKYSSTSTVDEVNIDVCIIGDNADADTASGEAAMAGKSCTPFTCADPGTCRSKMGRDLEDTRNIMEMAADATYESVKFCCADTIGDSFDDVITKNDLVYYDEYDTIGSASVAPKRRAKKMTKTKTVEMDMASYLMTGACGAEQGIILISSKTDSVTSESAGSSNKLLDAIPEEKSDKSVKSQKSQKRFPIRLHSPNFNLPSPTFLRRRKYSGPKTARSNRQDDTILDEENMMVDILNEIKVEQEKTDKESTWGCGFGGLDGEVDTEADADQSLPQNFSDIIAKAIAEEAMLSILEEK